MTGRAGKVAALAAALAAVSAGGAAVATASGGSHARAGALVVPRAAARRAVSPSPGARARALVAESLRFRRASGLTANPALVRRLVAERGDHRASLERFGVPLTAAELRNLQARGRVAAQVPTIRRQADRVAGGSFAGLYVDQRAGGVVRVGFTRDAARHLRALRRVAPFPDRLRTFTPRHSQAALRALAGRVALDPGAGVIEVAPDLARDSVDVGATHPTPELARRLRHRYKGVPIRLVASAPLHALSAEHYDDYPAPPMRGALQIRRHDNLYYDTVCSAGFVSQGSIHPRNYWVISAGHCGPPRALWTHPRSSGGDYRVGRGAGNELRSGSDADAQAIGLDPAARSSQIYLHDYDRRRMRYQQRYDTDYRGEMICHAGDGSFMTTGEGISCGYITATDARVNLADGANNYTLYHQRYASLRSCAGDSGGPIFKGNTGLGILSGGDGGPCGNTTTYSQIGHVTRRLHVHLYGARVRSGGG